MGFEVSFKTREWLCSFDTDCQHVPEVEEQPSASSCHPMLCVSTVSSEKSRCPNWCISVLVNQIFSPWGDIVKSKSSISHLPAFTALGAMTALPWGSAAWCGVQAHSVCCADRGASLWKSGTPRTSWQCRCLLCVQVNELQRHWVCSHCN